MTVQIEYEAEKELGIDYAALANEVAAKILDMENCPYDAQVNLVLTDNEEIKKVNTEFRDIQAPTDVLSFPANEFAKPGVIDDEETLCFDPESGELVLGDIVISIDKVKSQSRDYGHS